MPSSDYVGDIEHVSDIDGCGALETGWYQCRGHPNTTDFRRALVEQWGVTCDEQHVERVWMRYVPRRIEGDMVGYEEHHPSRGATPTTSVATELCRRVLAPEDEP